MFPVLVRIDNKEGLLRPGMNSEVEIHVGRRDDVLAVPNAALRTQRDVGSAAQVLGLSPEEAQQALAAGQRGSGATQQGSGAAGQRGSMEPGSRRSSAGGSSSRSLERGATAPQPRSPAAPLSRYIVFVKRNGKPVPVWIRTGLTDMDYSEVLEGLSPADSVLILPSASLVQSQQDMRERFNRITGGGAVPGMQQQTAQPSGAARP
jgi:HlyD family secretion protein